MGMTSTYVENTVKYELGIENGRDDLHIRGEYRELFELLVILVG